MTEKVDHPDHYNAHPSGVECITVVEHMTFNLGNAVKYIWRADHKTDAIEDLRKARWYIDRELERLSAPGPLSVVVQAVRAHERRQAGIVPGPSWSRPAGDKIPGRDA